MKKATLRTAILIMIFAVTVFSCLTACGNKAFFDAGNYTYTHIRITDYTEAHCLDIARWWDDAEGLEVETTDGRGIFLSEGTYQLFEDAATCPYCSK